MHDAGASITSTQFYERIIESEFIKPYAYSMLSIVLNLQKCYKCINVNYNAYTIDLSGYFLVYPSFFNLRLSVYLESHLMFSNGVSLDGNTLSPE